MRSTDERIAAVQNRSSRLRRRRGNRALAILVCLMALPLVDLVGKHALCTLPSPFASNSNLFGAASMFDSSIGGYVLVAVLATVIAVALTLVLVRRRQSKPNELPENPASEDTKPDEREEGNR